MSKVPVTSKKAVEGRTHGPAEVPAVVGAIMDPNARPDDKSVIFGEYDVIRSKDSTQRSLRVSEKVWTNESIMVHRGVATETAETRELGVVVCVETLDEESNCFDIFSNESECLQLGNQGAKSHGSQLDTIVNRIGPLLFQNRDIEAYTDFITYNDPVDDHKSKHGSLLPLWDVDVMSTRRNGMNDGSGAGRHPLDVTSMCWHATDPNLFAVGLGCLENTPEGLVGGLICVYSVADLQVPRVRIDVDVGVMSVAFAQDGRLAAGLQDGGLMVVCLGSDAGITAKTDACGTDEREMMNPRIIRSRMDHNHLFPIWHVRWGTGEEGEPSASPQTDANTSTSKITTISTTSHDGLEGHWQILHAPVSASPEVIRIASSIINQPGSTHPYDPDVFLPPLCTANSFQLKLACCSHLVPSTSPDPGAPNNLRSSTMFAYGTLEGEVGINGTWRRYHTAPVYSVQMNPFDPHFIMAASLDGSLSFWIVRESNQQNPEMILDVDVGEPIVDAQWSTQSSTICAAATESGSVCVFDLSVDKEVPICCQHVSNTSLTCLRFSASTCSPVSRNLLALGTADSRLIWLKLSPNLRIAKNATEAGYEEDFWGDELNAADLDKDREIPGAQVQIDHLHRVFRDACERPV